MSFIHHSTSRLIMLLAPAVSVHAQVTLSNMGATAPTGYEAGHPGSPDNRVGSDAGESFTPTATGNLQYGVNHFPAPSVRWLSQEPPEESRFLAASLKVLTYISSFETQNP